MINNAGLMPQALLELLKVDQWDRMIDVNIKGVLYGVATALPHEGAEVRALHQRVIGGWAQGRPRLRRCGDEIRRAGALRRAAAGGQPGAVATELPNSVTDPAAERIKKFYAEVEVPADSIARAVIYAMSQPDEVDINEILFRPTKQEL